MPDLVSLSDFKSHLGVIGSTDDGILAQYLEHTEALFESECGRKGRPFTAGASRTEVKDATGDADLFLDYPISTITSIKLGFDPTDPVETLDVADPLIVTFAVASRKVSRTDGGRFGVLGNPRYVQVVYAHQDELPEEAKMAVKSVAAIAYRRRGSEDSVEEAVGGFSRTLLEDIAESDPFWQRAVSANRRMVMA